MSASPRNAYRVVGEQEGRDSIEINEPFRDRQRLAVRAFCLGQRIDWRALEGVPRLGVSPLLVAAGTRGAAAVFRYGVLVLFDVAPVEEVAFLQNLRSLVHEPFDKPELDQVELQIADGGRERTDNGVIRLREFSNERLQVVADILAKSVILSHYEEAIGRVFDRVEPLAAALEREGQAGQSTVELVRHIGRSLRVQTTMVARVEVTEKPELLWERPELERLYLRLEDEYELSERHVALERKLALVSRTAETLLDLLHHNRSLRVEWYIVGLILVEIFLTIGAMWMP